MSKHTCRVHTHVHAHHTWRAAWLGAGVGVGGILARGRRRRSVGACSLEHRFIQLSTSICDGVTSALGSITPPAARIHIRSTTRRAPSRTAHMVEGGEGKGKGSTRERCSISLASPSDWGDSESCQAGHTRDGAGPSKSVMFCLSSCGWSTRWIWPGSDSRSPVSSAALCVVRAANYFRSMRSAVGHV